MSLAVLADHLASKGRNGDTMLVHMTPEEVHGLHALALANGGQLTINPETGLVEASFLKKLLPAIAGMALNFIAPGAGLAVSGMLGIGGAAAGAIGTGLLVGGVTGLATGSLRQGIMAGLGAYGGASLAGGLMGASGAQGTAGALGVQGAATEAGSQAAMLAQQNAGFGAEGLQKLAESASYAKGAAPTLTPAFTEGVKALGTETGRKAFMENVGGTSGLMRAGFAAAGPAMVEPPKTNMPSLNQYTGMVRPFTFDPYGQTYTPQEPYKAAAGGIVALAGGGGVPDIGTFTPAQRAYAEELFKRPNQGTQNEILKYVGGLNDAQSTASLASVQATPRPASVVDQTQLATPNAAQLAAQQSILADPQAAALAAAKSGIAAGMTDQQIANMVNQQYGKSFSAQNVADFIETNKLRPTTSGAAPEIGELDGRLVAPPTSTSTATPPTTVPGYTGQDRTYGGTDVLERVTNAPLGTAGKVTQENLTMNQVKDIYQRGGGSLGMPVIPFTPTPLTGGSKAAYDYLMGKGAYPTVPATPTGEIMRPYAEAVLGVPVDKTRSKFIFDQATRKYVPNPDYKPPTFPNAPTTGASGQPIVRDPAGNPYTGLAASYFAANPDVKQAYETQVKGMTPEDYVRYHWNMSGKTEGRKGYIDTVNPTPVGAGSQESNADSTPYARGGLSAIAAMGGAEGGQFNLGGYSDGGRLLRGPGDGVSDSIPATIGGKQPARLADGEFVIPARIVSEIGNGSTEAGARKLYKMMDRVQRARAKTTGKGKVAKNTRADKYLPA